MDHKDSQGYVFCSGYHNYGMHWGRDLNCIGFITNQMTGHLNRPKNSWRYDWYLNRTETTSNNDDWEWKAWKMDDVIHTWQGIGKLEIK